MDCGLDGSTFLLPLASEHHYNIYLTIILFQIHIQPVTMFTLLQRAVVQTKLKPFSCKNTIRSLQYVRNSSGCAVTAVPRASSGHSQQQASAASGSGSLSLAVLGAAVACAAVGLGSSTPQQSHSAPVVLPVEDELTPLYTPVFRESGMLKVSDLHTISYKVYGNPKGKPVLCVHGGPGAGTGTGKVSATSM